MNPFKLPNWKIKALDSDQIKKRVRTPTLLQMHATECGAACLGIVLAYFNCWIPLTVLRDKCEVSRDGSSAANIMRAAKSFGLDCRGLGLSADLLPKLKLPLILYWQYSHFIVLEGFDEHGYYINDPAIGRRKILEEDFLKGYSGLALQFEKGENFQTKGKRVSLFKRLQPLLEGAIFDLAGIMACTVMIALLLIVIPLSLKVFIDNVLISQNSWWIVVLILLLGGILTYLLTLIKQQILHRISIRLSIVGFEQGILRLLRLRITYFVHRMAGDILDRVLSNERIGKSLTEHYILFLIELTLATVMLFAMVVFDIWLTLLVLFLAIVQGILTSVLNYHRSTAGEILSREQGMLLGLGIQLLSYAENLRITGSDDRFFARWTGQQALELKARKHYTKFTHFNEALPIVMTAFRNAVIVIIGGNMVIAGDMTLGTFAGFYILAEMSMIPIGKLFRFTEKRSALVTEFQKLEDISKSQVDDSCQQIGTNTNSIVTFNGRLQLAGMVELKNITFGYNKNHHPLIKDFNLVIKPGQRVALVGSSGSGKSTIARILTGIVQPWEGEILFDNHTKSEIPAEVLNRSLAMADQEVVLFPATVRDNISLWNPEVPDDIIIAATRDACIHHEILIRPEGYSTIVQEGGKNFSGGQRQRIEIARALVGNPAMLILDEATSALDPLTEVEIDRAISRRGVTCLIIAHRLCTVRDCDLIVVLDQGKEVQRGTHDELIVDKNGTYFNLVMSE